MNLHVLSIYNKNNIKKIFIFVILTLQIVNAKIKYSWIIVRKRYIYSFVF